MKATKYTGYYITKYGRVFSKKYGRLHELKPSPNTYGYLHVTVSNKNKQKTVTIHSMVAEAYLGPCPEGYTVNHKDTSKLNNYYKNLEYVTSGDNTRHAHANGLCHVKSGEANHRAKLTDDQCLEILRKHINGATPKALAEEYNTPKPTIKSLIYGQSRKYLTRR